MRLQMGFLKLEISVPELRKTIEVFKSNRIKALEVLNEEIKASVASTINQLLNAEMTMFLGTPEQGDNKRNGYETKLN